MPKVTHVKKAQQRYATKPVIDPATGEQKKTPVMRNGVQRTTKKGKPVFLSITERDLTKPLEPYTCDACHKPIEIGTPYKHITPKSGPYGGRQRNRHESCPSWKQWEYSNSLSARTAQIEHEFSEAIDGVDDPSDVTSALEAAAESAREISTEKEEAASNIEEGFGHETEGSQELASIAEELENWASDIESAEVPDLPEPEEDECDECGGTGKDIEDEEKDCEQCEGSGQFTPEEPTDEQMDEWRSEVSDIFPECPV